MGVVLLLALATGASSLPVWVRATGVSALVGQVALRVSGAAAAPAVPATALVLAAAGAAVALAGRVGRWVVAAVVLAAGFVVVVAAAAVLADPSGPAAAAAASQTGVDHLAGAPGVTAAPWVALVVGAATAVVGVALARASSAWPEPSRRHEVARGTGGPSSDAASSDVRPGAGPGAGLDAGWTAQSTARPDAAPTAGPDAVRPAGPDAVPTAGPGAAPSAGPDAAPSAGPDAVPSAGPDAARAAGLDDEPDERADWDALSRGTDPSEGAGGAGSR